MKFKAATAITFLLMFWGAWAVASTLQFSTVGSKNKQTKPNEIITLVFEAGFSGSEENKFILDVKSDSHMSLISSAGDVMLTPGVSKRIILSFLVSGDVEDGQALEVNVSMTCANDPSITASASSVIYASAAGCAKLEGSRTPVEISADGSAPVQFTIQNCGENRETFALDITPGKSVTLNSTPDTVTLSPGESARMSVSPSVADDAVSGPSSVFVRVLKKGVLLAEKSYAVNVKSFADFTPKDKYQFISLNMKLEYLLGTGMDPRASLQFSIPTVRDNAMSFKSDVWMSSHDSKIETRRQSYEFGLKNYRLSIGNQQYIFSRMLDNASTYDGRLIERRTGNWKLSFFSGGEGANKITAVKWEGPVTPRLTVGAGRILSGSGGSSPKNISDNKVNAVFKMTDNFSIDAEMNSSKTSSYAGSASANGLGLQFGGRYQSRSLQITALARNSSDGFEANDFFKGYELHADYDIGADRAYFDLRRHYNYRVSQSAPVFSSAGQDLYRNALVGYVHPIPSRKAAVSISFNSNKIDMARQSNSGTPLSNGDNAVHMELSKQIDAFSLSAGIVVGKKGDGVDSRGYHEYDYSAKYNNNRTNVSVGLTSSIDFNTLDKEMTEGHNFSLNISHALANEKTYFQIGWKKDLTGNIAGLDLTDRLIARISSKLSDADSLEFIFESVKDGSGKNNLFTIDYQRSLNVKIPYKKFGVVSGAVFEDINRNKIFDTGDKPIKKARVRVGGSYMSSTDANGRYVIKGIPPAGYKITLDGSSFPVGLSLDGNMNKELDVKNGGKYTIDMPLQRVATISGQVVIDKSDYFAKYSRITPSQIKITLSKDGRMIEETFTGSDGGFYFENVSAGVYDVTLDLIWLPTSGTIVGKNIISVDFSNDKSNSPVVFTIRAKQKTIIKTLEN